MPGQKGGKAVPVQVKDGLPCRRHQAGGFVNTALGLFGFLLITFGPAAAVAIYLCECL